MNVLRYLVCGISIFFWVHISSVYGQHDGGFVEFPLLESSSTEVNTSRKLLSVQDSLFVEVVQSQKYLLHKVYPPQTLYSIKKFYGLQLADLYYYNPELHQRALRHGQLLKIPIATSLLLRRQRSRMPDSLYLPVYYRVKPGETLYRVARGFFKMPVEDLQQRNRLSSTGIRPYQVLHIGWFRRTGVPDSLSVLTGLSGVVARENASHKKRYLERLQVQSKEQIMEGVAYWRKDKRLRGQQLAVLHDRAPIGSIMRLENPLAQRTLYAKVVGRIPHNSFTEGAIVVLTPTVAQALGAFDPRFFVHVYYVP